MLTITGLIILIIIALLIWFWESSMRAKELAITASKKACKKRNLQFLDGTTNFQKITLQRNDSGRIRFKRRYGFDYYDGQARLSSTITIFDNQVIEIGLPPINDNSQSNNSSNIIQFPTKRS